MASTKHIEKAVKNLLKITGWKWTGGQLKMKANITGFGYSDFDRAGRLRVDSLARFLEFDRFMFLNLKQALDPYISSPASHLILAGTKYSIEEKLYHQASLQLPMEMECHVEHIGNTSITSATSLRHAETQEPLAYATRRPTLVNVQERRTVQLPPEIYNFVDKAILSSDKQLILPKLDTMQDRNILFTDTTSIKYSDYDHLYHVNQSCYITMALNCIAMAYWSGKLPQFTADVCHYAVRDISLIFHAECFVGDTVETDLWQDEQDQYKLYLNIRKGDISHCHVVVHYAQQILSDYD